MPEAITKYAINSTLGTDDFKPLDKIITGEKVFGTSDVAIAPAYSDGKYFYFTPKINGVVRAKIGLKNTDNSSARGRGKVLNEDGAVVAIGDEITVQPNRVGYSIVDFACIPNKKYRISYERTSITSSVIITTSYYCAQVTDYNYFESEEV